MAGREEVCDVERKICDMEEVPESLPRPPKGPWGTAIAVIVTKIVLFFIKQGLLVSGL